MAKYLIHATYTVDGVRGLLKEGGSSRQAAIERAITSVGGRLDVLYYCVGAAAAYLIVDCPDSATITAIALTAEAAGTSTITTAALISPEELDEAVKLSPVYRAPGQ